MHVHLSLLLYGGRGFNLMVKVILICNCLIGWVKMHSCANKKYIPGVPLMASAMVLHSLGEYNYVANNTVVTARK